MSILTKEEYRRHDGISAPEWMSNLKKLVTVYEGGHRLFLETFVPSRTTCPRPSASSRWTLPESTEHASTSVIEHALQTLTTDLPADRALAFLVPHGNCARLPFPFAAFVEDRPDDYFGVYVPFPGRSFVHESGPASWRDVSMIVETDFDPSCGDPFLADDPYQHEVLIRMGAKARNLMFANGLLAAFVVCFYQDTVRIARFDHACAVVTAPLSLRSVADMEILREFFWRFVHPWDGAPGRVVGSDSTMRLLTDEDHAWVEEQLGADILAGVDLREGRRVEVYGDGEKPRGFVLFQLVAMTSSIFSRATTVWRAIEDTRGTDAVQDSPPEVRIVKEAWRRIDDPWEKQCYARLAAIPPEELYGLPGLVCGEDVGEREHERWKADCVDVLAGGSDLPLCAAICAVPSAFGFGYGTTSEGFEPLEPPLLPYPMHQTYTSAVASGLSKMDRSHMRLVVDTVGRPLMEFESSKELVTAIRDAIMGHQVALERAGILHCDISPNNIMLVNKELTRSSRHTFIGFLHDFDISWLSKAVPTKPPAYIDWQGVQGSDESGAATSTFKGMPFPLYDDEVDELIAIYQAGTFQFLAIDMHYTDRWVRTVQHDLEAFYWVLVWMVMYHLGMYHGPLSSYHEHPLFTAEDFYEAAELKTSWLLRYKLEDVVENPPLAALMSELSRLVFMGANTPESLTYDSVLAVFNAAIARDDWPDDATQDTPSDLSLSPTSTAVPDCVELEEKVTHKRKFEAEEGQENERPSEWIQVVADSTSESERREPKRRRQSTWRPHPDQ